MKDNRFIQVDKREPVDDFDDYSEESSEDFDGSLFVGGQAGSDELERSKEGRKLMKDMLYIAS